MDEAIETRELIGRTETILRCQDALIHQLSERLAICSELLSRAAERHDNAERLRQRIAELESIVDARDREIDILRGA